MSDITPNYPLISARDKIVVDEVEFGNRVGGMTANATSLIRGSGNSSYTISEKGIHLGAADFADAPFSVDMEGNLHATTGTFTGDITGATGTFSGSLVANSIHIPSENANESFHTDTSGNSWWGSNSFSAAPASISKVGYGIFSGITISGGSVYASTLNGTLPFANLDVAHKGWSQTCVFSSSAIAIVDWGDGTFTTADGTEYTITGSNTGVMTTKTYIYLDTAVSTTAYQTTTTASTAVGAGKVLVATAENSDVAALFNVMGGMGGIKINADNIEANSITANELSTSIIYTGTITLNSNGNIKGGQTAFDTGTGFFLGYSGGAHKFSIGTAAGDKMTWDGSELSIVGNLELSAPLNLESYTVANLPIAPTTAGFNPPSATV